MTDDKKYIDWLTAILRNQRPKWPGTAKPESEQALWQAGLDHGVLALCHYGLSSCSLESTIPAGLRQKIKDFALRAAAAEILLEMETGRILLGFAKHQISYLLLKGTPLAYSIYPQAHLRLRCDTDILFPDRAAAEKAADLLIAQGYTRPPAKKGGDASYEFGCFRTDPMGVTHRIDIHWRINNNWVLARSMTYGELAAAAIPVPQLSPAALTLSLPHTLILCCLHRIAHKPYGDANRLLWLYDIHLICAKLNDAQWTEFTALVIKKGLCDICLDGLHQARICFDTTIPEPLENQLIESAATERFNRDIGNSRTSMAIANFRALPGWKEKGLFLKEHLFPDTGYMLNKYNTRNRLLLPFLYIDRLMRGLGKLR